MLYLDMLGCNIIMILIRRIIKWMLVVKLLG